MPASATWSPSRCTAGAAVDTFLEEDAERVIGVGAERSDTLKSDALVQGDGGDLVNAGFETQQADTVRAGVVRQMVDEQLRMTAPTKRRPNVHAR